MICNTCPDGGEVHENEGVNCTVCGDLLEMTEAERAALELLGDLGHWHGPSDDYHHPERGRAAADVRKIVAAFEKRRGGGR